MNLDSRLRGNDGEETGMMERVGKDGRGQGRTANAERALGV